MQGTSARAPALRSCRGPAPFRPHSIRPAVVPASTAPTASDAPSAPAPAPKQQKQKQQQKQGGGAKVVEAAVTPRSEDFGKWYLDVVAKAELADYGPVRGGSMGLGASRGPKCLWVQSYRDLPLLMNQWCNVHRWEMRTRPFIRTLEFLWQEGHTAHATAEEAEADARRMVEVYTDFATNMAAMPVVPGRKSRIESFAGANCTYTIEAMMGDRRALQAGTSHNLGTNFAKAFGTQYLDRDSKRQFVHQSSWGVSTRVIGGIIMTHGDDKGLRLPPRLAPVQVVIIPIVKKEEDRAPVNEAAQALAAAAKAAGIRVKVDLDDRQTPGWKYNYWEMRGVPVRVEVGPKDVQSNTCVTARRDMPGKEGKQMGIPMEASAFTAHVAGLLEEIQAGLLAQAAAFRDENIVDVASYEELKAAVAAGKWARGGWAASDEDERRVKEETQATLRCFPFAQPAGPHTCLMTGQPAAEVAIFAKSY
ncbi:Proline--tRNA ligase [Tetrabaena socialis]|uniref:proline--tRNA ligase n=1 Tax=Tetrabaena socialis TaxID=47790 RepID=A0A2J8A9J7_9CHLO|nr:Proline--tRNA ligase [Tetrabaena socialis]|eukprot:PNH09181.1 Proline--tRNA ligase [Tetrabaena socialis]